VQYELSTYFINPPCYNQCTVSELVALWPLEHSMSVDQARGKTRLTESDPSFSALTASSACTIPVTYAAKVSLFS